MGGGQVILIGSDALGRGDQRLGSTLMVQFLRVLLQREAGPPAAVVVVNAGVRLLIDGSPALAPLQALEAAGVPIVACRSSVEHFDLEEELVVGDSTPMADLVEQLLTAESVIAL